MDLQSHILGCLLDTEHTAMVGRALVMAEGDPARFEGLFASQLTRWLLCCPAGIGLATLKACLKLLVGFPPSRSGVFSAGNGPAMRAALLGLCTQDDECCRELVRRSTRITHTDPKAEEAALVVARAARLAKVAPALSPPEFVRQVAEQVSGEEIRSHLCAACKSLAAGHTPGEYAAAQGWSRGVSGYINQTVPAALYCWAASPHEFRQSVTSAVLLGGDSDSVAAITGAIAGANLGAAAIPSEWIDRLGEWPRTVRWMEQLAAALARQMEGSSSTPPPRMHWPATLIRNGVFACIVITLALRRLLPPY